MHVARGNSIMHSFGPGRHQVYVCEMGQLFGSKKVHRQLMPRRVLRSSAHGGGDDDHVLVIQRLAGLRTSPLARGFCGQGS